MTRLADLCGWIMIFGIFYAFLLFTCAIDNSCAVFFMEPI